MKYLRLKFIDGSSFYGHSMGQGELEYINTIFREYNIPSLKKMLQSQEFQLWGYGGDSLRLRPHKEDLVGIGSIFDYEDDEDYQEFFIPRQNLIELLDQWVEIRPTRPPKIFILEDNGKFYLTTHFPTKYAELHKVNHSYKLIKSDDENTELIGELLENVLNNHIFLEEYKLEPLTNKWNVNNLLIKGFIDHYYIGGATFYAQINRNEFIHLIEQWQKLVKQGSEKIYLVLEDGDFRVTDKYNPL